MGRNRQIYVTDEINELLNNEANASKLINDLLLKYYKHKNLADLSADERILELEAEKKFKIEVHNKEIEKIEQDMNDNKKQLTMNEQFEKMRQESKAQKIESVKSLAMDIWNVSITDDEANEYINNSDIDNLKDFLIIKKGIDS